MSRPTPNAFDADRRARRLTALLRRSCRRRRRQGVLATLLAGIAVLLAGATLLILAESALYLPETARTLAWAAIISLSLLAAWRTRQAAGHEPREECMQRLARQAGHELRLPQLADGLDLWRARGKDPDPLYRLAIERNLRAADPDAVAVTLLKLGQHAPQNRLYRTSAVLAMAGLLLILLPLSTRPDAALRSVLAWQRFEPPNPWSYTLSPDVDLLEHGAGFAPVIRFDGSRALPGRVSLFTRSYPSQNWQERPMTPGTERSFRADERQLTTDTEWYVRMDRFRSDARQITIRTPPRLDTLRLTVTPPPHTGLGPQEYHYPESLIRAPEGSRIEARATANRPLQTPGARLWRDGDETEEGRAPGNEVSDDVSLQAPEPDSSPGDSGPQAIREDSLTWRLPFTLDEPLNLTFAIRDREGIGGRSRYRIRLEPVADRPPRVRVLQPAGNLQLARAEPLEIRYLATDDYRLTRMELSWQIDRAFADRPERGSLPLPLPDGDEPAGIVWNLNELDLRPRDVVTWRVTAWDNDAINGPKAGQSDPMRIELLSMTAQLEEVERQQEQTGRQLQQAGEQSRQMRQQYERLRDRLRDNPVPDEEHRRMGDELDHQRRELDEAVAELNRQFEELSERLGQGPELSAETRRATQELHELFRELDDPALRQAMQELQEAMASLDPMELQRALENFEFNEELYRQRVERTLELFRALRMNSDLERLAGQFDELAAQMESLAGSRDLAERQQQEQERIRGEAEPLDEPLSRLGEQAPANAAEQIRSLREQSRSGLQEILERMDRLISQGEAGQSGESLREGRMEVSERLSEQAGRLRAEQRQISGRQTSVNLLALQRSLYWLLELSDEQQSLLSLIEQTPDQSSGYVGLARRQQEINRQFSQVADTLRQVSARAPALSEQVNRRQASTRQALSQTLGQLAERRRTGSHTGGSRSLAGINELASMIADVVEQLMNQQGEGDGSLSMGQMGQDLEGLGADQQALNRQLDQLINDMQGERLSVGESERLDQLARQQQEIRNQIQRLQRSGALPAGDRRLSELEQIARQMEQSISGMRGGSTSPVMRERQLEILSRMLQTQQSLQEQGEAEEHRGEQAGRQSYEPPPETARPEQAAERMRLLLADPRYTPFRQEWRELIERYLERLEENR